MSYDEKPGIQAIKNISDELKTVSGEHPAVGRDYEYKSLGTAPYWVACDLHTEKTHMLVKNPIRSG